MHTGIGVKTSRKETTLNILLFGGIILKRVLNKCDVIAWTSLRALLNT